LCYYSNVILCLALVNGYRIQSMITQIKNSEGHILLLPESSEALTNDINSNWFDANYWISNDRIEGQSRGRHTTWFLKTPLLEQVVDQNQIWVLRHYYRGGLIAKVNNDKFLYTGIENTRCYREIKLLQQMLKLNLPVPTPIAGRLIKTGLFYRADLLMDKLQAKDLVTLLKTAPLATSLWEKIGSIIAQFHSKGIYHADLNAHNIMIDVAENIYLIDFDRCQIKAVDPSWQQQNLQRLQRSFLKEKGLFQSLNFDEKNWQSLNQGYSIRKTDI